MARRQGILRPRDLEALGFSRMYLTRLHQNGLLTRVGRGLYVAASAEPTESHSLAQACKRIPEGVICLLSALRFHDITTQLPHQVWLALDRKAWLPQATELPLRIVRFSGAALIEGVEEHEIEGVKVKVYNPAKTVADCFKYRNKIGLDVALEALRECRRERRCTSDDLWHLALRVLQPQKFATNRNMKGNELS